MLAASGRGQLQVLEERVQARRRNFDTYVQALGDLPGIAFMPEAPWGRCNRWLTVITVDPAQFGADREAIRLALEAENIEARPVWKPMHRPPPPQLWGNPSFSPQDWGDGGAEALFCDGLCLPSGTALTDAELDRIVSVIRSVA